MIIRNPAQRTTRAIHLRRSLALMDAVLEAVIAEVMIVTVSWMIMSNVKVNGSGTLGQAMSTARTRGRGSMVLATRLAREVYRASSEEILGVRLKQYALLGDLRES